jgi:restriction system protein
LLEATRRGYFRITGRGRQVLAEKPIEITAKSLERFPEFMEFKSRRRKPERESPGSQEPPVDDSRTPGEALEDAYQQVRRDLAQELLNIVRSCPPEFFENLVVELLLAMGYGGSRRDAGETVGRSGDGGIDGIIKEDRLGLDVIYVQAKRWQEGQTLIVRAIPNHHS